MLSLIFYILVIVARWRIFQKFGEPGWKSLIPIYSDYITFRYVWNTGYFWLYEICYILASVLSNGSGDEKSVLLMLIAGVLSVLAFLILAKLSFCMARSFRKSNAFALGLVFLCPIFELILGMGQDAYIGNQS